MAQDCLTCYLGDGYLTAAAAFPTLTEGFNLDDIVLVDRQWQLQRGGVGLHYTGTAVFVLAVHHLLGSREKDDNNVTRGMKSGQRIPDNTMTSWVPAHVFFKQLLEV